MAKQTVNIGTSANKGDGDPLRSAFDKINDNFNEVYPRLDSLEVANNSSGNMIEQSIIGSVFGADSTQLVDGLNSTINGPISSETWTRNGNVEITVTAGTLALQASTGDTDFIKIGQNTGVNIYSDSNIKLNTNGQGINIGENTSSGDVQIGHSSSNTVVNGTLTATLSRIVATGYTTTQRNGLAAANGEIIYNQTSGKMEAYANGAWVELH